MSRLTPREQQVLDFIAKGHGPREIAQQLGIRPETARKHRDNAVRKSGTGSQVAAILQRRSTATAE